MRSKRGVVAPQILLESTNQLKSSTAARDAAKATITTARGGPALPSRPTRPRPRSTSRSPAADLVVAESEAKRLEAWVGYLTLTAPFDGVIVARNANTVDFVLPPTGDPTAMLPCLPIFHPSAPHRSTWWIAPTWSESSSTSPNRTPTTSRSGPRPRARQRFATRRCRPRHAHVWALNVKSRTLRAEIDLPNPGSQILAGDVRLRQRDHRAPGVRALPLDALVYSGDQTFCWRYEKGHAVRTEIETGVSDGDWIEVTNRRIPSPRGVPGEVPWTPIDGTEQVILGDLSVLVDGSPVQVAPATGESKVASATPDPQPTRTRSSVPEKHR